MADVNKFFMSFMKDDSPTSILELIPELSLTVGFPQLNDYHIYDVWTHTVMALHESKGDYITNLAILFHDIGKPKAFSFDKKGMHFYNHSNLSKEIIEPILKRITDDHEVIQLVLQLVYYHDIYICENVKYINRVCMKIGNEQFKRLLELQRCDILAQNPKYRQERLEKLSRVLELFKDVENQNKNKIPLAINGHDLIEIGIQEGPMIGKILQDLKTRIKSGDLLNDKLKLIDEAKKYHIAYRCKDLVDTSYLNFKDISSRENMISTCDTLFEIILYLNEHPDIMEEIDERLKKEDKK